METQPHDERERYFVAVPQEYLAQIVGTADAELRALEGTYPGLALNVVDGGISAQGASASEAAQQLQRQVGALRHGSAAAPTVKGKRRPIAGIGKPLLTVRGTTIRAATKGQAAYVNAMDTHSIVFGIGPAGTGKTYLAMARAVRCLLDREVERIILTRPAVEAGERLGFLPGTLSDKIDPYLRPLFDALSEMLEPEMLPKLMETGVIEVAPLAYMRGRTLNDSFIVLDEAQNTTPEQMKMFLTRLGFGSRMVVTGDATQVDLPGGHSGLQRARRILGKIDDIAFCDLTDADVIRHELVAKIVNAYTAYDEQRRPPSKPVRRKGPSRS